MAQSTGAPSSDTTLPDNMPALPLALPYINPATYIINNKNNLIFISISIMINNPFSSFFNIAKLYVMAELRHTQK
jgi:hypothetical protein